MASEQTDTPVLDVLAAIRARITSSASRLVASDAPPISYALNLGVAGEAGIDPEKIRGVFAAIAPIVGSARIATAMGNVARALAMAELAEYGSEDEEA